MPLIACAVLLPAASAAPGPSELPYLELEHRLDRPQDGYCLDVAGSGPWIDVTVPVSAHNCKRDAVHPDQVVSYNSATGRIRFPLLNVCLTALGRAGRSLAHMPLMVRPCAEDTDLSRAPFSAPALQSFIQRADGRLELKESGLCLTVGRESSTTFSVHDRWRALYLDRCSSASTTYSAWRRPPAAAPARLSGRS